jgi:hypothetical protein
MRLHKRIEGYINNFTTIKKSKTTYVHFFIMLNGKILNLNAF